MATGFGRWFAGAVWLNRPNKEGNTMKIKIVSGVLVAIGLVLAMTAGPSVAESLGYINSKAIVDDSVKSRDIKNGTIKVKDLNNGAQRKFLKNTDVNGMTAVGQAYGPSVVENIGGRFVERSTNVGSFTLKPGTYLVSADGFFINNQSTTGQTRMQVALRGPVSEGDAFGEDVGTCFTGAVSPTVNREITCNTTRTVVVHNTAEYRVIVFGYADDQGSADSGRIHATVHVSAVRVGDVPPPAR